MADLFPGLRGRATRVVGVALAVGLPLGAAWFAQDGVWRVYPLAMGFTLCVGAALWWGMRRHARELQPRHGVMLVTLLPGVAKHRAIAAQQIGQRLPAQAQAVAHAALP